MKIKDLNIGNWVNVKGDPCIVYSINHFDIWVNNHSVLEQYELDELQPIPLTPKILEKNGFVRKDKYRFVNTDILSVVEKYGRKYYDYHNIYKKGKTYRPIRVGADNIKYVHELQHAMRLAGIDKEIEV